MPTTAPQRTAVAVREIAPGESMKPFIDLAWAVNARDPAWVAPLRMAVSTALDRRKHPFHQHAEVAYFLAERGGRVVGRIAAIVNHRHNEFHEDKLGFFGLFECLDDADAARALVERAAAWLAERGMERMMGPVNLSTNEEVASPGVLVDGFETPPVVMMSHNPPYYARLLEEAGLEKEKDLLAFWVDDPTTPARLLKSAERIMKREQVTIRSLDLRKLNEEIATIQEIYNAAWSRNWGFVPMTDAEFAFIAKDLKPVVDEHLCLIAYVRGEPVGFSLALPDLNRALKHLPNGRLFPFGFLKFLWHKRKITSARVMTLGMKPQYQHLGLGAMLYMRTFQVGAARGYRTAEASWILEDNAEMLRPLEKIGARAYKTYRLFATSLG
jgi:GNAT superfamily N-acetyltransferase